MPDRSDEELMKIIRNGQLADNVYPVIEAMVEKHKRIIYEAFEDTACRGDEDRKNLWQALHVANKVLEYLTHDISKGKDAKRYIDQIRKSGRPTLVERVLLKEVICQMLTRYRTLLISYKLTENQPPL